MSCYVRVTTSETSIFFLSFLFPLLGSAVVVAENSDCGYNPCTNFSFFPLSLRSPCPVPLHPTPAGSGVAAEGCRWWSAPSSPGTCATRCCQGTSRMSWSVWLTSPWPTSYASSAASVSNKHNRQIHTHLGYWFVICLWFFASSFVTYRWGVFFTFYRRKTITVVFSLIHFTIPY